MDERIFRQGRLLSCATALQTASAHSLRWLVSLVFLVLCLSPSASWAAAGSAPDCSTGVFEVTATAGTQIQVLSTKYPDTCALIINGVRVELYAVATADADHELNYVILQDRLRAATGAGGNPDVDISFANIFSSFLFVVTGRIPYTTYSSSGMHEGYVLAPLSEQVGIIGTWIAPGNLPSQPLRNSINLTIRHQGSLSFWGIVWMKGANLLALLLLLFPLVAALFASEFPELSNTLVPINTPVGKVLIFLLIPGVMIGVAYIAVAEWGYSTVPLFFAIFFTIAAILTVKNAIKYASVKQAGFDLYFNEKPPLFEILTVNHNETEVEDVPIASSYFAKYVLWLPHKQHCEGCNMNYVVHTASIAERPITRSEYAARNIGRDKATALAQEAVNKSRAPVNGCPKCGTRSAEAFAAEKSFRASVTIGPAIAKIAGGAIGAFAGGMLWMGYNAWDPHVPYVGPLIDYVLEIIFGIVIFIPLGIFFYGLYELVLFLSDQYVTRSSSFFRIWACTAEGLLFEDPELVADHSSCLSCKKTLKPLRSKLTV
jgi:hypothetical protein